MIFITLSLGENDRGDRSADAFLSLLLTVIVFSNLRKLPSSIADKTVQWQEESKSFVDRYELNHDALKKLVSDMELGSSWQHLVPPIRNFFKVLGLKKSLFGQDPLLYPPQPQFLTVCSSYFEDPEYYLQRIEKLVSSLHDPELLKLFTFGRSSSDERAMQYAQQSLEKLVRKVTGKKIPQYNLSAAEKKKLETDPEAYQLFLDTRSELLDHYKSILRDFVRSSGKSFVPVDEVRKLLAFKNLGISRIPQGFVGNVDETGALYTKAGDKIDGIPNAPEVIMNPDYESSGNKKYVFRTVPVETEGPEENISMNYYTVTTKLSNRKERFEKVESFSDKISEAKAAWRNDLNSNNIEGIIATIVEIIYTTSARIGSDSGMTAGNKTFGISSLQKQHVTVQGTNLLLKYPGKKSMPQQYLLPSSDNQYLRKAIQTIIHLLENKKEDDYVFTFEGKRVTEVAVNNYLKRLMPGFSAHYFRRIKGTELFIQKLTEFTKQHICFEKMTQKEMEDFADEHIFLDVGKQLGHFSKQGETYNPTPTTARINYIDPILIQKFFLNNGKREPKWLTNIVGLSDDET